MSTDFQSKARKILYVCCVRLYFPSCLLSSKIVRHMRNYWVFYTFLMPIYLVVFWDNSGRIDSHSRNWLLLSTVVNWWLFKWFEWLFLIPGPCTIFLTQYLTFICSYKKQLALRIGEWKFYRNNLILRILIQFNSIW